ncbi:hypothetical protein EBA18_24900 (plasmid) [Xanthomonas oryzae pv. oryzae]|nr:hypothetical protein EBA18_24900 [Xanthomonas oryzae pv. oryzae]
MQVVLVLSTGRGPRPAATGGSARLAQHARWTRGGRTARRVLAPPAPARGDPHTGQPQLAADQASGARRGAGRRPGGWTPLGGRHRAHAAVHA